MSEKRRQQLKARFLKLLTTYPVIEAARQQVGIPHSTVYAWRKADQEFDKQVEQALQEGDDVINDLAESKLIAAIKNGNMSAIRFRLQHKHKSYMKQQAQIARDTRNPIEELLKAFGVYDERDKIANSKSDEPDSPSNDKSPP